MGLNGPPILRLFNPSGPRPTLELTVIEAMEKPGFA
jgi:hypothetical protein